MHLAVLLLLALGATARITRFITTDTLIEPLRIRLINWSRPGGLLGKLVTCGWCASIWVAAPVSVAAWIAGKTAGVTPDLPAWFAVPALWLTLSYTYGLLAQNLDGDE